MIRGGESSAGGGDRVGCPPLVDLLEYQGKRLFAKHGVPVPEGRAAATVEEAVDAAQALGFPCVIKAQVLIGGRGKAGGIKVAKDRDEAEEHARAILGMDIKGFTVHELYVEAASDIDEEYYAAFVFDRSAKKPMAMFSKMGGMDVEEVAETDPEAMRMVHVDPADRIPGLPRPPPGLRGRHRGRRDPPGRRAALQALRRLRGRGRDAGGGQPAADHEEPRGGGARREGHDRRQRPVPPSRLRRVPQHGGRRSPGGDGP